MTEHPSQSSALGSEQPAGTLHAPHLLPDGLLVERGPDGLLFTKVCQAHQRASLTVSDSRDLITWACALCEAELEDRAALIRYALLHDRLVVGMKAKREEIGRDVERTFGVIGMTKQEAAYAMGYSDAGTVSRWCAGTERPQFDKLFALKRIRARVDIHSGEARRAPERPDGD